MFREAIWVTLLFPQESNRHRASPPPPLALLPPRHLTEAQRCCQRVQRPLLLKSGCPLPRRAPCVWALTEPCLQHSNVLYARPLRATSPPLAPSPSLAHSLSSSHTSPNCAPPTSSGIHSKKTQASWQRAQTTLLKKERERMKKRQSEGGEQGEREGYPERKEVVKVRGKLREGGGS